MGWQTTMSVQPGHTFSVIACEEMGGSDDDERARLKKMRKIKGSELLKALNIVEHRGQTLTAPHKISISFKEIAKGTYTTFGDLIDYSND